MLDSLIQDITRRQRPYYLPQGNAIRGLDNQTWLIFQHRDGDNLLKNVVAFLGLNKGKKDASHRLIRIDPNQAKSHTYIPRKSGNLPTIATIRTSGLSTIEAFLILEDSHIEQALLQNSLREITIDRRYSLPADLDRYDATLTAILERTAIYRRSTGYFNSGVLKLYEEPLTQIVETEGRIQLLLDWCGFTSRRDLETLEKLQSDPERQASVQKHLTKLLKKLSDKSFNSTQLMAELVRLGFLQIKLIKMDDSHAIYHKKTGIFSDRLEHHILHEGSDNFTRAAHSRNAESVTFFSSWDSEKDKLVIERSIQEFDAEWAREDIAFDLTQDFLQQVLQERDRRTQKNQPVIESITPDLLTPGETTEVTIEGENLDQIDSIDIPGNDLIDVTITHQTPHEITADVTVDPLSPPQSIPDWRVRNHSGNTYNVQPKRPIEVKPTQEVPDFPEIAGFKEAVELILKGQHGTPDDFLYWLAHQRPQQFRVERSLLLDDLVYQGILFEHQKSGAQHCFRVIQDFGVAICADAVGLGKTRLAAAVARLYRQQNPDTKIAIIAAKKLLSNWEREMAELGFQSDDYERYNKNLMSRTGNGFLDDLKRYGGPDLVIIDEAHEGIRNYKSRIHKLCQTLIADDRSKGRQRHYLLLTACYPLE